jgi:4-alpha-glucanotransferase
VPCLPVGIDEFTSRGIQFDYARFCKPYITDEVLWEIFGEQQFVVKEQFLLKDQNGAWIIAPSFDTQLKVEEYFEHNSAQGISPKVKEGMFELIANVLLFEEPGSYQKQFHFRISIDKTWSFKQCAPYVREKLMELYHDYFYRRQDHFWYQEAMQKLPFLKESTNMLICGEDLGMVPHCVPDVMQQTGILSLEIQRMPKDPNKSFFNPADSPYLAVVTPSTHDMSTIRGWWEENSQRTQYFYNHEMHQWGDAPQFCEAWINRAIVEQHLNSPAMWSIFQIQDLMGMSELIRRNHPGDERINDPANPKNYWQYRMHIKVEELIDNKAFTTLIRDAIVNAGRV